MILLDFLKNILQSQKNRYQKNILKEYDISIYGEWL